MPFKKVEFHEEALAEAQAAYDWYATRNAAAAEAFIGELDHAVERIGMFPERDGPLKSAATQPQTISRNQCRIGGQSLSPIRKSASIIYVHIRVAESLQSV